MSLVLSRKIGQRLNLSKQVNGGYSPWATIVVTKVQGSRVTIAIDALPEVKVLRAELEETKDLAPVAGGEERKSA